MPRWPGADVACGGDKPIVNLDWKNRLAGQRCSRYLYPYLSGSNRCRIKLRQQFSFLNGHTCTIITFRKLR